VRAGDHAATSRRMLEPQPLDGVGQLDVDAHVVVLLFSSISLFAPPNGSTFMTGDGSNGTTITFGPFEQMKPAPG